MTTLPTQSAIQEIQDVAFLEPGRAERLDLYLPASSSDALRPAVVWIHGGGWSGGDKRDGREVSVSRDLANAGYVVASINYQLATDARPSWPQALLDCKNGVRFMRAQAAKYAVDPGRIAVMGGSAGGHLALMVGLTTGIDGLEPHAPYPEVSSRVQAIADFYGITQLETRRRTDADGRELQEWARGSSNRFLGARFEDNPDLWRLASPVTHVRPGIPPVFVTHGQKDATVNYGQAQILADALSAQGLPHEFVPLKEAGHTYTLTHWGKAPLERDLRPLLIAFLERSMPAGRGEPAR